MDLRTLVSRRPHVAWREIDGTVYLVDPATTSLHKLNDTGAEIWKFIETEKSLIDVANFVRDCFNIEQSVAEADTAEFLAALAEKKLVNMSKR